MAPHKKKKPVLEIFDVTEDDKKKFIEKTYPELCKNHKYTPAIIKAKKRVVVFGDIHGDYKLAVSMFLIAKLIEIDNNNKIKWVGKDTYVVQVGDQVDRCRPVGNMQCDHPAATLNDEANDIKILKLFNNLNNQAMEVDGAVISLLGNHEILNSLGHMDYVSYKGLEQFDNYKDPKNPNKKFRSGHEARTHAFAPGNEYGKLLGCTRLPVVIIGNNIFVHAGVVDGLIEEIRMEGITDFEKINIAMRKWLLGILDKEKIERIIDPSKHSIFWTRLLGKIPPDISIENSVCKKNITNVLDIFNVSGIIVGHTPQSFLYTDDINSTCSGKVWRVDNGASSAFDRFDKDMMKSGKQMNSRRIQYLEIIDDKKYFVCDASGCKRDIYRE